LTPLRPGIDQIRIQLRSLDSEITAKRLAANEAHERLETLEKEMKKFKRGEGALVGNWTV